MDRHELVRTFLEVDGIATLRSLSLYLQRELNIGSKATAGIISGFTYRSSSNPFLKEVGGEGDNKLYILNPDYMDTKKETRMPANPASFDVVRQLIIESKGVINYELLKQRMAETGHFKLQGTGNTLRIFRNSNRIIVEGVPGEKVVRLAEDRVTPKKVLPSAKPVFDWAQRVTPERRISITAGARVVNANLQGTSTDLANVFAVTFVQNGFRQSQVLGAPIIVTVSRDCPEEAQLGCYYGPVKMIFTPKDGERIVVNGEEQDEFILVVEKGEAAYLTGVDFEELPSVIPSVEVLIDGGIFRLPVVAMFITQSAKFHLRDAMRILLSTSKDLVFMGEGPEESYLRPKSEPLYLWFYVPITRIPAMFVSDTDRLERINVLEGEREGVLFKAVIHPGEHVVILPSYTESI